MLQTITKDEFELRGRTYFPDFSRIFFVLQRVAKMAHFYPFGHDNSSLSGRIFTKLGTHMLQIIINDGFEFGGHAYFPDFSIIFFIQQGLQKWPIYTILDTITRVRVDRFLLNLVHTFSRPQQKMSQNLGVVHIFLIFLDFFRTVWAAKMAYLHPSGHNNSSLDG